MLQNIEGKAMEVVQDIVHFVRASVGASLAGRAARPQRPDAANQPAITSCLPAGEALGLPGQVV